MRCRHLWNSCTGSKFGDYPNTFLLFQPNQFLAQLHHHRTPRCGCCKNRTNFMGIKSNYNGSCAKVLCNSAADAISNIFIDIDANFASDIVCFEARLILSLFLICCVSVVSTAKPASSSRALISDFNSSNSSRLRPMKRCVNRDFFLGCLLGSGDRHTDLSGIILKVFKFYETLSNKSC